MNKIPELRKPSSTMVSVCLALAVVVFVGFVFSPVLSAGFSSPADEQYVYDAGRIWSLNLAWDDVARAFDRGRIHHLEGTGGYYQPLPSLSLRLDAWLTLQTAAYFGGGPSAAWLSRSFQFHFTNLLLHLANTILIFILVRRLTKTHVWPVLLALFFALHPVQVESVACISQRMTLLGTFFSLITILCYMRSRESRWWFSWLVIATMSYVGAVLCRPLFVAVPIALLALDVWPLRRTGLRPLLEKMPMLIIAVFAVAALWAARATAHPTRGSGGAELVIHNLASLVARIFWPAKLLPYHPESTTVGGWGLGFAFDAVLVIALVAAIFVSLARHKAIFAALAGAALLLVPALLEVPYTNLLLSDQYLYAVLIMPLVVFAIWLGARRGMLDRRLGQWSAVVVGVLCAVFSVQSYAQTMVWQSSRDLYERATELHPGWTQANIGFVEALIHENEYDHALSAVRRAARQNPEDPSIQFYIGTVLLLNNDTRAAEAIEPLRKALQSNPEWIECLQNLGVALARSGRDVEAIQYLELARDLQPASAGIRLGLGNAYLKVQRFASARKEFQEALRRHNEPMAHLGLAIAWAANDEPEFARRHLEAAISKDPGYARRAGRSPELRKYSNQPGFRALIDLGDPDARSRESATDSPAARSAHGI